MEETFQRLVGRGVGWHLGAEMGVLAKLDSPHWSTSQAQRSHVRRGPICTTHRREDIKKGCGGTQASGDPPCPIDPTTPQNRGAVCPGPTLTPLYPIDPILTENGAGDPGIWELYPINPHSWAMEEAFQDPSHPTAPHRTHSHLKQGRGPQMSRTHLAPPYPIAPYPTKMGEGTAVSRTCPAPLHPIDPTMPQNRVGDPGAHLAPLHPVDLITPQNEEGDEGIWDSPYPIKPIEPIEPYRPHRPL